MPLPIADIARFATTAAASMSVGKVLTEVIKNNIPESASHLDTIQVKVGTAVLSFVVAGAARRRIEDTLDEVIEKVIARKAEVIVTPS